MSLMQHISANPRMRRKAKPLMDLQEEARTPANAFRDMLHRCF
jgi:hypothetical protein